MSPMPPNDFVPGIEPIEGDFEREPGAVLEPEFEVALGGEGEYGIDRVADTMVDSELIDASAYGQWLPEAEIIETRGTWSQVWRRFRKDKFAVAGLVVIVLLVIVAVFAPWLAPHSPLTQYDSGLTAKGQPVAPGRHFWLGTDLLGRDMLSRLMYGARVSLVIGVLANGFALLLGVIFGILAGYFRGWLETLIMRATDVMLAFPIFLLAIALSSSISKPGIWVLVVVIGIVYWAPMTRVIHGEVLSIREKEFVMAARLTGCTDRRILTSHILPHLVAPIIVYTSLGIATTVLLEASLSFIGLGVQPPTPSWGQMIADGQQYYTSALWLTLFPGLCIMITVLAFNLVGDGLRDAFDPQQRRR
jgi:peptide/nickel transport system permease protein